VTDKRTSEKTDGRTNEQDPEWGLLGRLHIKEEVQNNILTSAHSCHWPAYWLKSLFLL